jgi:hypothetical protein
MALNAEERRLLQRARMMIVTYNAATLCRALELASNQLGRNTLNPVGSMKIAAAYTRLINYVRTAMGDSLMLATWQSDHGFGDRGDTQRRADRLAWIDWMLDQPK